MKKEEKFLFGATVGALGALISYAITSEPVRNVLNSAEKKLKSSGHNIVGGAVGSVKKFLGNVGNVAKASPLTPPIPVLSRKFTISEARIELKKGDHVAVDRWKHYSHHGIYTGDGFVIEYGSNKEIHYTTLENFLDTSHYIYKVDSEAIYSPERIVARAKSRLYEHDYSVFGNNCEQFARWCRNGD